MTTNKIAGHGQHSHEVPTEVGLVVEIRDGQHEGTHVWRAAGRRVGTEFQFLFASLDSGTLRGADRCLLIAGQDVDDIDGDDAYGCDLDNPRGLVLIGCSLDDDLSWLSDGAEVLWDSAAQDISDDIASHTKVHLKITQLAPADRSTGLAPYRIRALNPKTAALESELASATPLPPDGAADACYRLARERGFEPVSHSLDVLLQ